MIALSRFWVTLQTILWTIYCIAVVQWFGKVKCNDTSSTMSLLTTSNWFRKNYRHFKGHLQRLRGSCDRFTESDCSETESLPKPLYGLNQLLYCKFRFLLWLVTWVARKTWMYLKNFIHSINCSTFFSLYCIPYNSSS